LIKKIVFDFEGFEIFISNTLKEIFKQKSITEEYWQLSPRGCRKNDV